VIGKPLEECLLFLAYKSDLNFVRELLHDEAMAKVGG
jgi:hypothetical protein